MRRIYESDAISRDDEDAFTPGERDDDASPQAFRSINAAAWSDRLLPHALRCRAVSVALSVPRRQFTEGETIQFRVTMKNHLPLPVTIRTVTPVLWTWSVDGYVEASHVELRDPPDEEGKLRLNRGETIRFGRTWSQMFRVTEHEWEPAEPGEYTLRAAVNVLGKKRGNLADKTTIEIVPA